MDDTVAIRFIQAQLQDLLEDPPPGVNAGPTDDDLLDWTGFITGPPGTPYDGGIFCLSIKFSESYPYEPPLVKFSTPILHPNVNEKGDICLSILFKNCSWDRGWSPAISITSVLLSIVILLSEPNTDHSLRPDLSALYLTDREAFDKAARAFTEEHAK